MLTGRLIHSPLNDWKSMSPYHDPLGLTGQDIADVLVEEGGDFGGFHDGAATLVSLGAALEYDDSTSTGAVLLPMPPSYSVGDMLIAIGVVQCTPGTPSAPLDELFPGGKWVAAVRGTSYLADPSFGDFAIEIYARVATGSSGSPDSDDTDYLRLWGQGGNRSRWGQMAAFSGMKSNTINLTNASFNQEPVTASTDTPIASVFGSGGDTLALLAVHRFGNADGSDDDVSIAGNGYTDLEMETLHTVNIPSTLGDGALISGWSYLSRSAGRGNAGGGTFGTNTWSDSQKTCSCGASLKSADY